MEILLIPLAVFGGLLNSSFHQLGEEVDEAELSSPPRHWVKEMNFAEWEPIYQQIVTDFKFSREQDEAAAPLLNELVASGVNVSRSSSSRIEKRSVCGDALSLEAELRQRGVGGTIMAAGWCHSFTPLAGYLTSSSLIRWRYCRSNVLTPRGPCSSYAHGDNMDALKYVCDFQAW